MNTGKTTKKGMFVTDDGQNVLFTFLLLILLFALWGFCNGMIDVMDKHFQEVLHLSLSQSASVQFAHYLGYFLMALPAGWLASKLGYKGGIIAGLFLLTHLSIEKLSVCFSFMLSAHARPHHWNAN